MNVELEIVKLSDEDVVTVSVGGSSGGDAVACSKVGVLVDTCDPEME
jgi:hypothetical protein